MKMLFGLRLAVYFLLNQLWLHVSCNLFVVVVTYLNRAPFPEKNCHKLRNIVLYYTPHYTFAHLIKPYRDPVHLINWISVRFYETDCIKKGSFGGWVVITSCYLGRINQLQGISGVLKMTMKWNCLGKYIYIFVNDILLYRNG